MATPCSGLGGHLPCPRRAVAGCQLTGRARNPPASAGCGLDPARPALGPEGQVKRRLNSLRKRLFRKNKPSECSVTIWTIHRRRLP